MKIYVGGQKCMLVEKSQNIYVAKCVCLTIYKDLILVEKSVCWWRKLYIGKEMCTSSKTKCVCLTLCKGLVLVEKCVF